MFANVASTFEIIYLGEGRKGNKCFIYIGEEQLKISNVKNNFSNLFFIFYNCFLIRTLIFPAVYHVSMITN